MANSLREDLILDSCHCNMNLSKLCLAFKFYYYHYCYNNNNYYSVHVLIASDID